MSLEAILEHIVDEADAQRQKIIQDAKKQAEAIIQDAKKQAEALYKEIMDKEKLRYEKDSQRLIVNARIESKKNLLRTKQELLDIVFEKIKHDIKKSDLKKQKIMHDKIQEVSEDVDFYMKNLRADYEGETARILFE